jgi:hypothetical protein
MRTMEPREKVRFEKDMKVAYFLFGSGTVGGNQWDCVGFQYCLARPKKKRWMEVRQFHGSVLAP